MKYLNICVLSICAILFCVVGEATPSNYSMTTININDGTHIAGGVRGIFAEIYFNISNESAILPPVTCSAVDDGNKPLMFRWSATLNQDSAAAVHGLFTVFNTADFIRPSPGIYKIAITGLPQWPITYLGQYHITCKTY